MAATSSGRVDEGIRVEKGRWSVEGAGAPGHRVGRVTSLGGLASSFGGSGGGVDDWSHFLGRGF